MGDVVRALPRGDAGTRSLGAGRIPARRPRPARDAARGSQWARDRPPSRDGQMGFTGDRRGSAPASRRSTEMMLIGSLGALLIVAVVVAAILTLIRVPSANVLIIVFAVVGVIAALGIGSMLFMHWGMGGMMGCC